MCPSCDSVFQFAYLKGDRYNVPLLPPCLIDRYHPSNGGEQCSSHSYLCRQRRTKQKIKQGCHFEYTCTQSSYVHQTVVVCRYHFRAGNYVALTTLHEPNYRFRASLADHTHRPWRQVSVQACARTTRERRCICKTQPPCCLPALTTHVHTTCSSLALTFGTLPYGASANSAVGQVQCGKVLKPENNKRNKRHIWNLHGLKTKLGITTRLTEYVWWLIPKASSSIQRGTDH